MSYLDRTCIEKRIGERQVMNVLRQLSVRLSCRCRHNQFFQIHSKPMSLMRRLPCEL